MKAVMQDMAFEMRRRQSVNQAKAERHVRDVLDSLCMYTYYRHRARGSDLQEACDDMVEDYEQVIESLHPSATHSAPGLTCLN